MKQQLISSDFTFNILKEVLEPAIDKSMYDLQFKEKFTILNLSAYSKIDNYPEYVKDMIDEYCELYNLSDRIKELNSYDRSSVASFIQYYNRDMVFSLSLENSLSHGWITFLVDFKRELVIILAEQYEIKKVVKIFKPFYKKSVADKKLIDSKNRINKFLANPYVAIVDNTELSNKINYNLMHEIFNASLQIKNPECHNTRKLVEISDAFEYNKRYFITKRIDCYEEGYVGLPADGEIGDFITSCAMRINAQNFYNFVFDVKQIDDFLCVFLYYSDFLIGICDFKSKEDIIEYFNDVFEQYDLDFDLKCHMINKIDKSIEDAFSKE